MSDERWLEERLRSEAVQILLPPRERWRPQARPSHSMTRVLFVGAAAVVIALAVGSGLRSLRENRDPAASTPLSATGARPQATPAGLTAAEAEVRKVLSTLTFRPIVPHQVAAPVTAAVRPGCGIASECLEITWELAGVGRVRVLEGPAGCCLDAVRPNAVRDIEIRPGVFGQYDAVQPQFGGPILWWTDSSSGDHLYLAISSPAATLELLASIARDMRPLGPAGFREGRCYTGPANERARGGEYVFLTNGVIDPENEFLDVWKRGSGASDQISATLTRLDDQGDIRLPSATRTLNEGRIVFRLPVHKPAGPGCWNVAVIDGNITANYIVEVR